MEVNVCNCTLPNGWADKRKAQNELSVNQHHHRLNSNEIKNMQFSNSACGDGYTLKQLNRMEALQFQVLIKQRTDKE